MDMNPGPTEDQERSEEVGLGSFRGIGMYQRAYWQIQAILDEVLGGETSDGVGEGIVADVRLALERRYRAGREDAGGMAAQDRRLRHGGEYDAARAAAEKRAREGDAQTPTLGGEQ